MAISTKFSIQTIRFIVNMSYQSMVWLWNTLPFSGLNDVTQKRTHLKLGQYVIFLGTQSNVTQVLAQMRLFFNCILKNILYFGLISKHNNSLSLEHGQGTLISNKQIKKF